MIPFGYIVLSLSFTGLIFFCLYWGFLEFRKPRDSGPLLINLKRRIEEKKHGLSLRNNLNHIIDSRGWSLIDKTARPPWLIHPKVYSKIVPIGERNEIDEIWQVDGNLFVPDGAEVDRLLVVNKNFKTGNDCSFNKPVYVKGNSDTGSRNKFKAITCNGHLVLGHDSQVTNFIDSDGLLEIGNGCEISGNVTSSSLITIGIDCNLKKVYSPAGYVLGCAEDIKSVFLSRRKSAKSNIDEIFFGSPEVDDFVNESFLPALISSLDELDEIIIEKFGEVNLDHLMNEISYRLRLDIPANIVLNRADLLGLTNNSLERFEEKLKPEFAKASTVWGQDFNTVRVKGDIRVPDGEQVPYNLIVEGDLISGKNVRFYGNLHVKGKAVIGSNNILHKSIVCRKSIVFLDNVLVNNCVDADGNIFIKGLRVGLSKYGGGISSKQSIILENLEGSKKMHSEKGIHVLKSVFDEMPNQINQFTEGIRS